jgi:hypothetical protein
MKMKNEIKAAIILIKYLLVFAAILTGVYFGFAYLGFWSILAIGLLSCCGILYEMILGDLRRTEVLEETKTERKNHE